MDCIYNWYSHNFSILCISKVKQKMHDYLAFIPVGIVTLNSIVKELVYLCSDLNLTHLIQYLLNYLILIFHFWICCKWFRINFLKQQMKISHLDLQSLYFRSKVINWYSICRSANELWGFSAPICCPGSVLLSVYFNGRWHRVRNAHSKMSVVCQRSP